LGTKLIVEGEQSAVPDPTLIKLVLKAEALRTTLMTGGVASHRGDRKAPGSDQFLRHPLLRLAFLAPDITAAILHGRHSPELTGATLLRHSDWVHQRSPLGFV
jgi:site-specific DNA recombinase